MLVFWPQRLVFLAVPKTGTTAWQHALAPHASMVVRDPPELKHTPLYRYNRFFRPMFERLGAENMRLVAVVREPVSWLASWYKYRQRAFLDGKPQSTKGLTFDQFILAYCSATPPEFAQIGSQSKFLEPRPNGTKPHKLFPYDRQDLLCDFFQQELGGTLNVPLMNVSDAHTLDVSDESLSTLKSVHRAEFALWDRVRLQEQGLDSPHRSTL